MMKPLSHTAAAITFIILHCIAANANTRILSSDEGLSNNAVYNIVQDSLGVLYIGTLDGLNVWDGYKMEKFRSADGRSYFEGNKIKHLFHTAPNRIIAHTRHGIAKINIETKEVIFIENLDPEAVIGIDGHENIFAITGENRLQYLNNQEWEIIDGFRLDSSDECHRLIAGERGIIHVFSDKGTWRITLTGDTPRIAKVEDLAIKHLYVSEPHCSNPIYTISDDFRISTFDSCSGTFTEICRFLPPQGHDIERIKGVVRASGGYWINFWDQLFFLPDGSRRLEPTEIKYHSFTIVPDRYQPILWIGTDSNGLIAWCYNDPKIRCHTFKSMPYNISMPVRCIYLDNASNTLLFGTKGDGLFHIRNFSKDKEINPEEIERLHTANSPLIDNTVYCITESCHGCLLIGTEGNGINYLKNGRIGKVKGSDKIRYIHQIAEQNDSTIWAVTGENWAYKARLVTSKGIPVIKRIDTIHFHSASIPRTQIFNMAVQNDSIVWFGSKGYGGLKYNTKTDRLEVLRFPKEHGIAINEIAHISKHGDMVFSTRNGIVIRDDRNGSASVFESTTSISAKASVKDSKGNLWISTSSGIAVLDSNYTYLKSYGKFSGLQITDYSDRACYRDERTGTLFFGGVNGLTVIDEEVDITQNRYLPQIHITKIASNNEECPLRQALTKGRLELPYSNSAFSVSFSAIDHINQQDYRFLYHLEGHDDKWHKTDGRSISFPVLPSGKYTLQIKYINSVTGTHSPECSLPIRITPPPYRSLVAYIIYIIIAISSIYWIIRRNKRKQVALREELRQRYKERIREIKADTSAAISEDISVTTTYILGLCQQIHTRATNIPSISEKVALVEYNIDKIRRTLNMWNDLRNISENSEEGESPTLVSISRTIREILEITASSYKSMNIRLSHDIPDNIVLAIDKERTLTLLNSITNTVYATTAPAGKINFKLSRLAQGLVLMEFTFTADHSTYRTLVEHKGMLDISSEELPVKISHAYDTSNQTAAIGVELHESLAMNKDALHEVPVGTNPYHENVFIASRNKEIISFIGYFLSDRYNVSVFSNNDEIIAALSDRQPSVIIYDSSSLQGQITDFMGRLKANKRTSQTPVITLLSSLATKEKELCLKAGCDLCLAFPFNVETFLSSLDNLIERKESAAEYYSSPDSSFVLEEGKAIHNDEVDFIRKVVEIIDSNMSDPKLSSPMIADLMGISTRVLYRKIEKLTEKSLRSIIIECRMRYAAKLIATTRLSINEIMYRTGHDNLSTFYRNFKNLHGVTPKEYRGKLRKV